MPPNTGTVVKSLATTASEEASEEAEATRELQLQTQQRENEAVKNLGEAAKTLIPEGGALFISSNLFLRFTLKTGRTLAFAGGRLALEADEEDAIKEIRAAVKSGTPLISEVK